MSKEQIVNEIKELLESWVKAERAFSNCCEAEDYVDNNSLLIKLRPDALGTREKLEEIKNILGKYEDYMEDEFWGFLEHLEERKPEILNEIFDININAIPVKDLRKKFYDDYAICEFSLEHYCSNWELLQKLIGVCYKNLITGKFNYEERPFFNDNFAILKILSDCQIKIGDGYYVALSQKDVAVISGFSVNKAQGIMNSLIRLEYLIKADNGKYQITNNGKAVLESLLKVPVAKIIE